MAPEIRPLVSRVTFVLMTLAALAAEVAADDQRPALESIGLALIWIVPVWLASWFVRPPADPTSKPPMWLTGVLLLLAAAPFLLEPYRRDWFGIGYPLEIQLVLVLRNLGLGLALASGWLLCLRTAAVVSLFLILFAVAMTDHVAVLVLLGCYTAAGSIWLMLVYWASLRTYFIASDATLSLDEPTRRERLPWMSLVVGLLLLIGTVGATTFTPHKLTHVLGEWLATSGGTGAFDPFSRGGVNDGDDEIRGEQAKSTGMTQTETFLESPLPSLYDLVSDSFGEPFKPKEQQRAIALDQREKARESKERPADNLRPNREFTTNRRRPRESRTPEDRSARAMFEIVGRTPLHLRATAYDLFDGVTWSEAPYTLSGGKLDKEPNSCWFHINHRSTGSLFADEERHQIKITRSSGKLVPTPLHTIRFRLGKVDQPDFFGWAQDGILKMPVRDVPEGVILDTVSRVVDPAKRASSARLLRDPLNTATLRLDPRLRELARTWAGESDDWARVQAIVDRLKSEYIYDPLARPPEDCADPLAHFLLESRRGPSYAFASAAATLVRSLGYKTRLVIGFYAAPEHYDPVTRHTPVVEEDLHCWAEVATLTGEWLLLEATPGYQELRPTTPWSERLWSVLVALAEWSWRNALPLSLTAVLLAAVYRWRRELLDAGSVARWHCLPGSTWRDCVRETLRMLERRGRWAGQPRPSSRTGYAWLRERPGLDELAQLAAWAAYAPHLAPPWSDQEARLVCLRALERWTLQRWQQSPRREAS